MASPNDDFFKRRLSLQDLEVPYGDRFTTSIQIGGRLASGDLLYDYAQSNGWFSEPDDSPLIGGIDQFKEMAESKGVRFNWFEYKPPQNLTVNQAESIIERQRQLSILQENAAAGNSGFFGNAGLFLGHLIGGMTDPLEMLLAVVPTERAVSAARSFSRARTFADQVAIQQARSRAATSFAARTRERFVEGAAGGALNNALFEPAYAYMATALGDDYGVADFAMNIGFGGLFGGGIRSIGGAVGDLRRGLLSRDPDVRQRAQELYQQQFAADVRNFESDPVVQNARMFSEYAGIERAINDASPRARNIVDALVDAAPVLRDLPENVRAGVLSDVSRGIDYADAISSGRAVIDPETGIARTQDGQPINLPEEVKRIGEFISKYENTPSRMASAVREYAADINRAAAIDRTTIPAYQRQEGSGLDSEGINRLRAADDAIARVESMPQTAHEQIARTSPDTKNDMLAVALGQVNADRNLAIEAIMGNDPAIRTASQEDIVSQARRSASNEGGMFYDKAAADEMKRSPGMRPVSQDQALNDAYSIMGESERYYNEIKDAAQTQVSYSRGPSVASATVKRQALTFSAVREAVRDFQGKSLRNTGSGITAVASRNNIDKMLSSKAVGKSANAQAHSMAVANLDQLFEQSALGWSKPDARGDSNITAIHRFFAPMRHGDKAYVAKITVKETAQAGRANSLYTVEAVEINEKSPAREWVGEIANNDGVGARTTLYQNAGDVLSIAQRVENFNQFGHERINVQNIETVARTSFGESTQKLMDAGQITVVERVADLPGEHPADVKAATMPDGRVYIVAENVSPDEIKGLVLHEVGVHTGMQKMLGDKAYDDLLRQVDNAIVRGEVWALEARSAVPDDTPAHLIREEILGYTVQNRPDLPFVKSMIAKVRAWLYKTFDAARRILKLNDNDISALATSALRQVDPNAPRTGRDIFYSRDTAEMPFAQAIETLDRRINNARQLREALTSAARAYGDVDELSRHIRETMRDVDQSLLDEVLNDLRDRTINDQNGNARNAAMDAAEQTQDAAQAAVRDITTDLEIAAIIEKHNRYLNEAKYYEAKMHTSQFMAEIKRPERQPGAFKRLGVYFDNRAVTSQDVAAIASMLVGTSDKKVGSKFSVDATQKSVSYRFKSDLINGLQAMGAWETFRDKANSRSIYSALHALGRGEDLASFPKEIAAVAQVITNVQEKARLMQNREGAWIRKLDDYAAPQSHDTYKIRRATFEEWREFVLPRLDIQRTFTDRGVNNMETSLRAMYDGLASGIHERAGDPVAALAFRNGSSVARKASQHRILHFKDGDGAFEYNERFGNGDLAGSIVSGIEHASRNIGLMRRLGTNPEYMINRLFDEYAGAIRGSDPERAARLMDNRKKIMDMLKHVDGSISIPANEVMARVSGNIRSLQSMAKLGGATISSFADLAVYASSLRFISGDRGMLSGAYDGLRGALGSANSESRRAILKSLGIVNDSLLGEFYNRFDSPDFISGQMNKGMRMYFKLNLLTPWTENLRNSFLITTSNILAERSHIPFADLPETTRTALGWYRIDEGKWNVLRQALQIGEDGNRYMTPEAIRTVPDAQIAHYVESQGRKPTPEAIANAREDIREAYHTFLINEMNAAVVEPGAKTRFTMYRGTQPGTVEGELMRFAMQFKSFPVAMAQLVLGREIYGRGYKSIGDFILHGQSAYGSMVSFMALSTVMGYLAMSIKDMLRGKEPRDPTDPRTFAAAFIQGGGAGIFGDFLFGEYNRTGGSLTATLAGPTLGSADQVANIFARLRDGDDTAAATFRAMLNNTPYLNLFYARPILNYAFLNRMQELMNPGSLQRAQERVQRDTGQTFWMQPDAMLF